ncbi:MULTISPECIES: hypothetical protein [unclassified Streptomyces]|uniref:hypothetical protein n=1 Tax=unclassified Streptomyces TaxID=2593676 RepID=UPI002DD8B784|nr:MULTISPECIES: hypothetical protein [unclassified Streptomyces]WSA91278.1 hypothetical protein OIE63_06740 [Streptomyces sp. NBC_01795]WSB75602.1 hypothetical protein OHB04_07265 [Streptomyces sp. NBC_01775]WSS16113.1 hypothetical protein OG533_32625 [Streptomyces sp. NBC_01186]WSS44932.1 hypothetical protein OG220_33300 [Streptomyces sp. NBC_01187]
MPTDHQPGAPIYDSLIEEQGDVLAAAREAAEGVRAQSDDLRKISAGVGAGAGTDGGGQHGPDTSQGSV